MATQEVMTVQQPQQQFSTERLALIRKVIAPSVTDLEFEMFIEVCKRTGLDPIARQIYAISRYDALVGGNKMTIQTSIDGYRLLAERSGKYAGQMGPFFCGEDGEWRDVWLKSTPPLAAKIGILRSDFKEPVWAVAKYESYVQRKKDGSPMGLWLKMPDVLLSKCAESLGLRRAFPNQLSGLYTHEEMQQSDTPLPTVSIVPTQDTGNAVEVPAEVVDSAPAPAPTLTQPAKPSAPAKKLSVVKPAPKQRDTQPLDGTVPEPPQDEQPPAPQVDEAVKSKLSRLFLLGETHGQYKEWLGMAKYATQVLGRPVHVKRMAQLSEAELFEIECRLQAAIADEEMASAAS